MGRYSRTVFFWRRGGLGIPRKILLLKAMLMVAETLRIGIRAPSMVVVRNVLCVHTLVYSDSFHGSAVIMNIFDLSILCTTSRV